MIVLVPSRTQRVVDVVLDSDGRYGDGAPCNWLTCGGRHVSARMGEDRALEAILTLEAIMWGVELVVTANVLDARRHIDRRWLLY